MPKRPLPDSAKRQRQREDRKDSRRGTIAGMLLLAAALLFLVWYMVV